MAVSYGNMRISSPAFDEGEEIPAKYTCDGDDVSPSLRISDVPSDAEGLALVMDDPDAPGGVFDHWIIWNIPPDTESIPEGVPPEEQVGSLGGALQGVNGFGEIGYRGPCPPGGPAHEYRLKLYALDAEVDLSPGVRKGDLEREMEGHIIDRDQLVGIYSR